LPPLLFSHTNLLQAPEPGQSHQAQTPPFTPHDLQEDEPVSLPRRTRPTTDQRSGRRHQLTDEPRLNLRDQTQHRDQGGQSTHTTLGFDNSHRTCGYKSMDKTITGNGIPLWSRTHRVVGTINKQLLRLLHYILEHIMPGSLRMVPMTLSLHHRQDNPHQPESGFLGKENLPTTMRSILHQSMMRSRERARKSI
jgi:hypothetical protein